MKYVVQWTQREGTTIEQNKRGLALFGKWTPDPNATFHQFLQRADGKGGFAVVEGESAESMLRDSTLFAETFEFQLYPVLEMMDGIKIFQEVMDIYDTVS